MREHMPTKLFTLTDVSTDDGSVEVRVARPCLLFALKLMVFALVNEYYKEKLHYFILLLCYIALGNSNQGNANIFGTIEQLTPKEGWGYRLYAL
eukprot:c23079_g1_i1 orf=239-520(+)